MAIQTIQIGDEGQLATRSLVRSLGPEAPEELRGYLKTIEAIDRHHGGSGTLPLEDAGDLANAAIESAARADSDDIVIGVALWAMRHEVAFAAVAPVVNALARRSNEAASAQELAAVFGLMQGFIAHVSPTLGPDLERSDPERPWRVMHANFAITAIRTEDAAMMAHAFDALDQALPDERGGFYAEAMALALAPRVAPAVREALEARHRRWAQA